MKDLNVQNKTVTIPDFPVVNVPEEPNEANTQNVADTDYIINKAPSELIFDAELNNYKGNDEKAAETAQNACESVAYDPVLNPYHYTAGRQYEPISVIHDWNLDFCLGNVLKYISRANRKWDTLEDLKKARFYLDYEIKQLEK